MSCSRQPSYLRDTLSSIPNFLVPEIFYQGDLTEIDDISCKKIEVARPYDVQSVHKNSQYNYSYILKNSTSKFIIEDDIFFTSNFEYYFNHILNDIENYKSQVSEKFVVALYSCYRWTDDYTDRPRLVQYPVESFYGTQAMLYDEYTAENFAEYLGNNIGVEAYDLALKTYISNIEPDTKLLASTRSLVQHIGQSTSGLGFFHQAGNYIED